MYPFELELDIFYNFYVKPSNATEEYIPFYNFSGDFPSSQPTSQPSTQPSSSPSNNPNFTVVNETYVEGSPLIRTGTIYTSLIR